MAAPKIVFEDQQFFVLEKPSGLVVNRSQTVKEKTLQDWLEDYQPALAKLERSGIVHRLDKETSGLLIVAKTEKSFKNLQSQFKKRTVKKKYLTFVHGRLEPREGEIALPIARTKKDREKFGVVASGRKARTKYKVRQYCDNFSLIEVDLLTGRTHQIRVHLSFLDHPVVADLKYGGKRARKDKEFCSRMFLHAAEISFQHPENNEEKSFSSSLPFELKKVILDLCGKKPA